MNRNDRAAAPDPYTAWIRHVQYPMLTSAEWREILDKHLPRPANRGRSVHHIALTLYMHADDDNVVSDLSPVALATETRTKIGAVTHALYLLEKLRLVWIIVDKITGARMYMLLRQPPPDEILLRV